MLHSGESNGVLKTAQPSVQFLSFVCSFQQTKLPYDMLAPRPVGLAPRLGNPRYVAGIGFACYIQEHKKFWNWETSSDQVKAFLESPRRDCEWHMETIMLSAQHALTVYSIPSGGSRISQAANPRGGSANLLLWPLSPENCMTLNKKLDRKGYPPTNDNHPPINRYSIFPLLLFVLRYTNHLTPQHNYCDEYKQSHWKSIPQMT